MRADHILILISQTCMDGYEITGAHQFIQFYLLCSCCFNHRCICIRIVNNNIYIETRQFLRNKFSNISESYKSDCLIMHLRNAVTVYKGLSPLPVLDRVMCLCNVSCRCQHHTDRKIRYCMCISSFYIKYQNSSFGRFFYIYIFQTGTDTPTIRRFGIASITLLDTGTNSPIRASASLPSFRIVSSTVSISGPLFSTSRRRY